ncbi:hypothetical protein HK096_004602, partial [Nowakowskiella sp. JEL0078]
PTSEHSISTSDLKVEHVEVKEPQEYIQVETYHEKIESIPTSEYSISTSDLKVEHVEVKEPQEYVHVETYHENISTEIESIQTSDYLVPTSSSDVENIVVKKAQKYHESIPFEIDLSLKSEHSISTLDSKVENVDVKETQIYVHVETYYEHGSDEIETRPMNVEIPVVIKKTAISDITENEDSSNSFVSQTSQESKYTVPTQVGKRIYNEVENFEISEEEPSYGVKVETITTSVPENTISAFKEGTPDETQHSEPIILEASTKIETKVEQLPSDETLLFIQSTAATEIQSLNYKFEEEAVDSTIKIPIKVPEYVSSIIVDSAEITSETFSKTVEEKDESAFIHMDLTLTSEVGHNRTQSNVIENDESKTQVLTEPSEEVDVQVIEEIGPDGKKIRRIIRRQIVKKLVEVGSDGSSESESEADPVEISQVFQEKDEEDEERLERVIRKMVSVTSISSEKQDNEEYDTISEVLPDGKKITRKVIRQKQITNPVESSGSTVQEEFGEDGTVLKRVIRRVVSVASISSDNEDLETIEETRPDGQKVTRRVIRQKQIAPKSDDNENVETIVSVDSEGRKVVRKIIRKMVSDSVSTSQDENVDVVVETLPDGRKVTRKIVRRVVQPGDQSSTTSSIESTAAEGDVQTLVETGADGKRIVRKILRRVVPEPQIEQTSSTSTTKVNLTATTELPSVVSSSSSTEKTVDGEIETIVEVMSDGKKRIRKISLTRFFDMERRSTRDQLVETIGFCPKGFIQFTRGFFKLKDYHAVIECVTPALRNERTKREAQHLLSYSFLHTGQTEAASGAFFKSINYGNETDWQPLVELFLDNPKLKLT